MAFTYPTITHHFVNADGTAASGKVEFSLSKRIANSGVSICPGVVPVAMPLDGAGAISGTLASNIDTSTDPQDSLWRVDLHILGAGDESFWIQVPTGTGPFDLLSLMQEPQ